MPNNDLKEAVEAIPDRPLIKGWQFVVIVVLLCLGLTGGFKLLVQSNTDHKLLDRTSEVVKGQSAQNTLSACRLRVAAEYEDKRDDLLTARDTAEYRAARDAFAEFRKGPHGENETRAERSARICKP